MPTGTISTPQFEAEIQMQIDSLDAMFQDPGLASLRANTPTHPGVVRRDMLAHSCPDALVHIQSCSRSRPRSAAD
jgi:hypothetical protein